MLNYVNIKSFVQAENISFDIDTDENMYKMGEKIQATLII